MASSASKSCAELADQPVLSVNEFPQISAQLNEAGDAILPLIEPLSEPAPAMAASLADIGDDTIAPGAPALTLPGEALALINAEGEVRTLEEIESEVIRFAINHYRGQMSEVARRLRIGRSTLYRKLESLGLDDASRARKERADAD